MLLLLFLFCFLCFLLFLISFSFLLLLSWLLFLFVWRGFCDVTHVDASSGSVWGGLGWVGLGVVGRGEERILQFPVCVVVGGTCRYVLVVLTKG